MSHGRGPTAERPAAASAEGPASQGIPHALCLRVSHSPRHLFPWCQALVGHRHHRSAHRKELDEILGEHQIEGPIDGHPTLLLEPRELAQIDGSPEPPCQEAGEVHAEDPPDACPPTDGCELTDGSERERPDRSLLQRCGDVVSHRACLTQGMDRAVDFYTRVLTFEKVSDTEVAGRDYELLEGVFGARARIVRLRLGDETLELTEYLAPKGRPVPNDLRPNDLAFQHAAIIVSDM